MLAPSRIPDAYRQWNAVHGAPFGRALPAQSLLERTLPWRVLTRLKGPFSIQPNSTIRTFEYPWACDVAGLRPGLDILEVGGGLSGFQFMLDRAGARVVNVDPGLAATGIGWPCDAASMAKLNRVFGTSVELRNTVLPEAGLPDNAFDVAFSISVLEHLPPADLEGVMTTVFRALRPGGMFVITVDLFLEVAPFTPKRACKYGTNVNVRELVEMAPFSLASGKPEELLGFPDFDATDILSNLSRYLVGSYPALAQCMTLRKPA